MPGLRRIGFVETVALGAILGVIVCDLVLLFRHATGDVVTQRIVSFDKPLHDMGSMRQFDRKTVLLRLVNRSHTPAVLSAVATSCHCTIVGDIAFPASILPGERIEIPVDYDSGAAEGDVGSLVQATLSDGNQSYTATAQLVGRVQPEYSLSRVDVDFGTVDDTALSMIPVVMLPGADPDARILSVKCSGEGFSADLLNSGLQALRRVEVTFRAPTRHTSGTRSGLLEMETTNTRRPRVAINLRASIDPLIELSPPNAVLIVSETTLGTARLRVTTKRPCMIREALPSDCQLLSVVADLESVGTEHSVDIGAFRVSSG